MRPGHRVNSCKANPPRSKIKVANRDSRSTLRSPVRSHGAFQLIEQFWINGIDRINQCRDGGTRCGTEKPAHGILRTRALHLLWRDFRTIDECLAVPLALDQSLAVKSIDTLRYRRVDQALGFTPPSMHVANGRRAEIPELRQNDVFQCVCRQLKRIHGDIVPRLLELENARCLSRTTTVVVLTPLSCAPSMLVAL